MLPTGQTTQKVRQKTRGHRERQFYLQTRKILQVATAIPTPPLKDASSSRFYSVDKIYRYLKNYVQK